MMYTNGFYDFILSAGFLYDLYTYRAGAVLVFSYKHVTNIHRMTQSHNFSILIPCICVDYVFMITVVLKTGELF